MPLESRAVIFAKVEPTYGTDAAPVAATDAILSSKPTVELITEDVAREVVLPFFGSLAAIPVATGIKLGFDVEVRGSGVATTPPRLGALLRACGFTQTIGSDVKYDPHSSQDGEGVTIYFYQDGVLYKALGCIGNSVKFATKANSIGKYSFEFTGLFGGNATFATSVAFPSPTFGDIAAPPLLRSGVFSFGTLTAGNAVVDAIEISRTNTVVKRTDANATYGVKRYSLTGYEVSGSFDPEQIALGTWNPWGIYETPTLGALSVTLGTAVGNRLVVAMPNCQIDAPKPGAREGILTYTIAFKSRATLTTGNNEVQFMFN